MTRYPALRMVSPLIKISSVITPIAGTGFSLAFLFRTDRDFLDIVLTAAGILASIVAGISLYAMGELIVCIMDIESHTRADWGKSRLETGPSG